VMGHSLANLYQGMLDVWGFLSSASTRSVAVRELAAEPGIPPEQKRHQNDQPPR
jgi:hypothetical protein